MTRRPRPAAPSGGVSKDLELCLSPSVHHRYVMDHTRPTLAYDGGDVAAWRRKLRARLRRLLGVMPATRVPLQVRSLWTRQTPLGSIEKIVFRSEPCADVPAYVCLPRDARPPYPWMICAEGHSTGMHKSIRVDRETERKPLRVPEDGDYAIQCLQHGLAALCVEQRALGERTERVQAKLGAQCHDAAMQALMLGRTLVGERVYDIDRALDYLYSRDDVDRRRIGLMGNSGGGTLTVYAAAMLPRIGLAMPSCSFGAFGESKMALYHCACGYIPRIMLYADMPDVLGLFAPRPVVVVAGRDDPIIPLPAARKGFRQLKRIYRATGAEDRCHFVLGDGGHRFYADQAWRRMLPEYCRLARG